MTEDGLPSPIKITRSLPDSSDKQISLKTDIIENSVLPALMGSTLFFEKDSIFIQPFLAKRMGLW